MIGHGFGDGNITLDYNKLNRKKARGGLLGWIHIIRKKRLS